MSWNYKILWTEKTLNQVFFHYVLLNLFVSVKHLLIGLLHLNLKLLHNLKLFMKSKQMEDLLKKLI